MTSSFVKAIDIAFLQASREHIHQHPELGFDVENTAEYIANHLETLGLNIKRNIGRTGLIADLVINTDYKTIALRADMDALPIQEKNTCHYKSKIDGKAHMCGHDAHCAIVMTTVKALLMLKDQLRVNVRFIFQSSEEVLPGGAPAMIADGALDGIDEIYGMHVFPSIDEGKIKVCQPVATSGVDLFDIDIIGKGGHASTPMTCIDPIVIAAHFISQTQTIISRNLSSFDPAVFSITTIHANVIAEKAILKGCIRYLGQSTREVVKTRLYDIANGTAQSFGAQVNINYKNGYPETQNASNTSDKAIFAAQRTVGAKNVILSNQPWMASGDFSYFAQKVPGCYIFLGTKNKDKGCASMVHEPTFDLSIDAMINGVNYYLHLLITQ